MHSFRFLSFLSAKPSPRPFPHSKFWIPCSPLIVRVKAVDDVLFFKPSPRLIPQSPSKYPCSMWIVKVKAVNDVLFAKPSARPFPQPSPKSPCSLLIVWVKAVNELLFAKLSPRYLPQSRSWYSSLLLIVSVRAVNDALVDKPSPKPLPQSRSRYSSLLLIVRVKSVGDVLSAKPSLRHFLKHPITERLRASPSCKPVLCLRDFRLQTGWQMDEVSTLTSFCASPIPLLTPWKILEGECTVISGSSSSFLIHAGRKRCLSMQTTLLSSSPCKCSSDNFSFLSLR